MGVVAKFSKKNAVLWVMVTVSPDSSTDQLCDTASVSWSFQALFPNEGETFSSMTFSTHFKEIIYYQEKQYK